MSMFGRPSTLWAAGGAAAVALGAAAVLAAGRLYSVQRDEFDSGGDGEEGGGRGGEPPLMTAKLLEAVCRELRGSSLLSVEALSKAQIAAYVRVAQLCETAMQRRDAAGEGKTGSSGKTSFFKLMAGRCLALLFYDPSTRTRCSFEAAMKRLGGSAIRVDVKLNEDSHREVSALPGSGSPGGVECLFDTCKMLSGYCDAVVLRHPSPASAMEADAASTVPVLNGGNSCGEHPTQALLDLFTIDCFFPSLLRETNSEPLRVTLVGDLLNGRTTHSLVLLLARYNTEFTYVAPEELQIPEAIAERVEQTFAQHRFKFHNHRQRKVASLRDALRRSDIVYTTRLGADRCQYDDETYKELVESFALSCEMLDQYAPETTRVLHPLPRTKELSTDVDDNPRQAYFGQARNGLYMRMAILIILFGRVPTLLEAVPLDVAPAA